MTTPANLKFPQCVGITDPGCAESQVVDRHALHKHGEFPNLVGNVIESFLLGNVEDVVYVKLRLRGKFVLMCIRAVMRRRLQSDTIGLV